MKLLSRTVCFISFYLLFASIDGGEGGRGYLLQAPFISELARNFDIDRVFVRGDYLSDQDLAWMLTEGQTKCRCHTPTVACSCEHADNQGENIQDCQSTNLQQSTALIISSSCNNVEVSYGRYRSEKFLFVDQDKLQDRNDIQSQLYLDSNVYTFKSQGNSSVELYEHYAIKHRRHVRQKVAQWSITDGYQWLADPNRNVRRSNLENATLVAAIKEFGNYVILDGNLSTSLPRGFFIDILEPLAKRLNFTIDYVDSVDGHWGTLEESGVWNGLVGMLARGEADIVAAALSITLDRSMVSPTICMRPSLY